MLECAGSRSKHKSEYGICFTWLFPCLSMELAFFFFFFFDLGFTACQDYFTHFEPSQSLRATKTGDPGEKNI